MARPYKVAELARMAGVTVRTLHHYDRIGLLQPSAVSAAGYRLYSADDLTRLQQIATLQWMGFSLREIGDLLGGERFDLAGSLAAQRAAVEAEIGRLRQVAAALERAALAAERHGAGPIDAETAAAIIRGVAPAARSEWLRAHYSDEQWATLMERARATPPEAFVRAQRDWAEVIAGFERLRGTDPGGPEAQALAARSAELVRAFTGGDPAMLESLERLERAEPERLRELRGYDAETRRFMQAALELYHQREER